MDPSELRVTQDALLDGRVSLLQPERGFRAGLDSVLLAASVAAPATGRVLEIGCGVGGALLAAAALNPHGQFLGVEREPFDASLALRNIEANGASRHVSIVVGDALASPPLDLGGSFDAAFCNPPFNAAGRRADAARAHGHHSEYSVDHWVRSLANRLRGGAHLSMIHRADALTEILAALKGRLGGIRVLPIHPFADHPAHRVLVRATKGSRGALVLLPSLALHARDGGQYTIEADAILRGRSRISWE
jgi:tRNA1(Val) A37 N6-methylase TrmN6